MQILYDVDLHADFDRVNLINGKHLLRRMPTLVHEFVAQKLGDAFKGGLESLRRSCNDATRRLIDDTRALGSADVRFTESWYRSPDQQFKVKTLYFPGIVYELAYAQTPPALTIAAKDYILESYGQVQKVVGLKIDPASLGASLTVWCPSFEVKMALLWWATKSRLTAIGFVTRVAMHCRGL
jgi:hypothetical protein